MNKEKKAILSALSNKPSKYHIEVVDSSMLPKELKKKKEITFVVKPPVLNVLVSAAEVLNNLPKSATDPKTPPLETAKYAQEMCKVFAIISHGNSKNDIPEWYVPFLMANIEPSDLVRLIQEVSLKTRTDFFLPCFQLASVMNPLTMTTKREIEIMENLTSDSTHTE